MDQRPQCPHCRASLRVSQLVNCRFIADLSTVSRVTPLQTHCTKHTLSGTQRKQLRVHEIRVVLCYQLTARGHLLVGGQCILLLNQKFARLDVEQEWYCELVL